jgi:hypothetical protein
MVNQTETPKITRELERLQLLSLKLMSYLKEQILYQRSMRSSIRRFTTTTVKVKRFASLLSYLTFMTPMQMKETSTLKSFK